MTAPEAIEPDLKQIRAELTELLHQLQQMIAVNQFHREAVHAWVSALEEASDTTMLGLHLTDQWQTDSEQRLKQAIYQIQQQIL